MVKSLKTALFLCFFSCLLQGAPVNIEVQVDSDLASENQPITGKIMIVHDELDSIDESSFQLGNSSLAVQLLSEGKQSSVSIINGKRTQSKHVISCYWFEIVGQEKGRHRLPPVSVHVGNAIHKSNPIVYHIHETEAHTGFHLDRFIRAPENLYPRQRMTVFYRLSLKTMVETTRQHFPLFDPPGFNKVGDQKIRQYRRGNAVVYEFSQELEAKESGEFEIEESFIEGLAYQEDFFSRRVYKKPKLRAKAKPIVLKVHDFPVEHCPQSFEGAVGHFNMHVELLSAADVCVGDKIELKLSFSGEGLETLRLPHFSKQQSLKNDFRFSDLPPAGKLEGSQKVFNLDLRPLTDSVDGIPPLEFSYFDPSTKEYKVIKSETIPLNIWPLKEIEPALPKAELIVDEIKPSIEQKVSVPLEDPLPALINISGVFPLSSKEIQPFNKKPFKFEWVLLLIGILGAQILVKKFLFKKRSKNGSQFILKEAFKYGHELQKYHLLLEKAFQLRLQEKGILKGADSLESLPSSNLNKEIKEFLNQVQHQLFSGHQDFEFEKSRKRAEKLFKKIGDSRA